MAGATGRAALRALKIHPRQLGGMEGKRCGQEALVHTLRGQTPPARSQDLVETAKAGADAPDGHVVLRVARADPGYQVTVTEGGHPNIAACRISR